MLKKTFAMKPSYHSRALGHIPEILGPSNLARYCVERKTHSFLPVLQTIPKNPLAAWVSQSYRIKLLSPKNKSKYNSEILENCSENIRKLIGA